MATPSQKKPSHAGKIIIGLLLLLVIGMAGAGYFSQSSQMQDSNAATPTEEVAATKEPLSPTDPLFIAKPGDIVMGNAEAPVTILDYSSLSCPHCAHFHTEILPDVKKQLLDTGKAKLVYRHFPLNEPALRASMLVECSDSAKRAEFLKVLFTMQKNWAFSESFKDDLKKIAATGGIDAAAFDSCMADKDIENEVLGERQEAATRAGVDSTPSFFINGVRLDDFSTADNFAKAVEAANKPSGAAQNAPAEPKQPERGDSPDQPGAASDAEAPAN